MIFCFSAEPHVTSNRDGETAAPGVFSSLSPPVLILLPLAVRWDRWSPVENQEAGQWLSFSSHPSAAHTFSLAHTQTCMPGIRPAPPPLVEDPYVSRAKHRVWIFIIFTLDYTRPGQWSFAQHWVEFLDFVLGMKMSSSPPVCYFHSALANRRVDYSDCSVLQNIHLHFNAIFCATIRARDIMARPRQNNYNPPTKHPGAQDRSEMRYHMALLDISFYITVSVQQGKGDRGDPVS